MYRGKNAQLGTQFNWVFILIIGAIILTFFIGVAMWYKGQQELKMAGKIVIELDSIFATANENPNTAKIYDGFPDVDILFTCDPSTCNEIGCASDFSGGSSSRDTSTEAIFAMDRMSTFDMISWALSWELPYKVTNFLYLTNARTRYIFIRDESSFDFVDELNTFLTDNNDFIMKEIIDYDGNDIYLDDNNDDYVRIISFVTEQDGENIDYNIFIEGLDEDWDVIYVSGDMDSGVIMFADGRQLPYVGLPMLIGGLFSRDGDTFECNVNKALSKANLIGEVYKERMSFLSENLDANYLYCDIYYTDPGVLGAFDDLNTDPNDFQNLNPTVVRNAMQTLDDTNNLAVINDCPRLY